MRKASKTTIQFYAAAWDDWRTTCEHRIAALSPDAQFVIRRDMEKVAERIAEGYPHAMTTQAIVDHVARTIRNFESGYYSHVIAGDDGDTFKVA